MDKRQSELLELGSYIQRIDKEVTMILQSLQWDRKHLIEVAPMTSCKFNSHHRVPPDKLELHEKECHLKSLGYSADDLMLPEPVDVHASTLVTLSKDDISNIIEYAAKIDPMFKKGNMLRQCKIVSIFYVFTNSQSFLQCLEYIAQDIGANCRGGQGAPLTLERLQQTFSAEERRAIHDAVVAAAPACHDLGELALPSDGSGQQVQRAKSRAEILAELRDMKRRRTKYRVPAKSRNYSDVLRGVIATQMEHYSEISPHAAATEVRNDKNSKDSGNNSKHVNHRRFEEVHIKKEPVEEEDRHSRGHGRPRDKSKDRYRERGREKRYDDYRKRDKHREERERYSDCSKERSKDRKDYRHDKPGRDDSRESRRKEDRRREYKDYSKSKNGDRPKREREHDSYERVHKEHKYKSSYEYKDDSFESIRKRIKREKD